MSRSTTDLWSRVRTRTEHALRVGALVPIETDSRMIVDGGVRFVVRSVSSLARKDAARSTETKSTARHQTPPGNPFLPYDPDLFVGDVSPTHVCLLNKFNVLNHHVLLVTRAFEGQDTLLNAEDFEALVSCLSALGGLGFYNGGQQAGASQSHKHLQIVPGPLADEGPSIPIDPLIAATDTPPGGIERSPALPFRHAFSVVPNATNVSALLALYGRLLDAIEVSGVPTASGHHASAPYNFLMTRQWMLAVPRRCESAHGVSVNALGFAGSLFVRSQQQMRHIERIGPMSLLTDVAQPSRDAISSGSGRQPRQ